MTKNFGDVFVTKQKSKSNPEKTYHCLCVALGYRDLVLTFDRQIIAEALGLSILDMQNISEPVKVGSILYKKSIAH